MVTSAECAEHPWNGLHHRVRQGRSEVRSFKDEPSPFVHQAEAFLEAMETRQEARNPPADALLDVRLAEAVSVFSREHRMVWLED